MAMEIAFTKFPVQMLTIAILPATNEPNEAPETTKSYYTMD